MMKHGIKREFLGLLANTKTPFEERQLQHV